MGWTQRAVTGSKEPPAESRGAQVSQASLGKRQAEDEGQARGGAEG